MKRTTKAAPVVGVVALALVLCPAALAALSTGDGGWFWQSPLPQGNDLEAVTMIDGQHLVAAGDNGTMLTSSDGGSTWSAHDLRIAGAHVNDVSFPTVDDGWAVVWIQPINGSGSIGDRIMHTSDGGVTWTSQSRAFATSITSVGPQHVWACGGNTVRSTTNGGATWTSHTVAADVRGQWYLQDISFVDATHGWAVGYKEVDHGAHDYPVIFATSDGGASWDRQWFPASDLNTEGQLLVAVDFVDAQHGWAVGNRNNFDGTTDVLATTDGGATWQQHSSGVTGAGLSDVSFVDDNHGWVTGGGRVLATTDGGSDWTAQDAGMHDSAVSFIDSLHGCAVGGSGATATTTNGGASWHVVGPTNPTVPTPALADVAFTGGSHGCAVGNDVIMSTFDGGVTWSPQTAGTALTSLSFPTTNEGWAVGGGGPQGGLVYGGPRLILHTTDGGLSWQTQYDVAGTSGSSFRAVDFVDAQHGWASGSTLMGRPCVARTTDGGATWRFVNFSTKVGRITDVTFVNVRRGWAVGYDDGIFRTTNGGLTWRRQFTTTRGNVASVTFVDAKHGWAVGASRNDAAGMCFVLKTTDGGRHWSRQFLSAQSGAFDVKFTDLRHGWIACGPTVFATTDGGRHWLRQRPGSEVVALSFLDSTHGWAVAQEGDWSYGGGGVLATTTGGWSN